MQIILDSLNFGVCNIEMPDHSSSKSSPMMDLLKSLGPRLLGGVFDCWGGLDGSVGFWTSFLLSGVEIKGAGGGA